MLSIRPVGCSNQQINYYVNLGHEDYYLKGGEAPGTWLGQGAKDLDLNGVVIGDQLRNLLQGYSPDGKRRLVQNAGKSNRRSAFDLTWSVPKSVSALWSQLPSRDRLAIEKCCEKAVRKAASAFQYLCGVSRRGHDGAEVQEAKLAMVLFRHETARGLPGEIPDPNLHWHLVVPNIAIRADGSTGAFDARKLFHPSMKMALGALFRAELSKELLSVGIESYRPQHPTREEPVSWFEVKGVPQELVSEMSKRRKEIETWLRKHGLSGAKSAENAALATRQRKVSIDRKVLFESWRELGQKHGFAYSNSLAKDERTRFDPHNESREAIKRAISRLTDHQAHFSKTEMLRFVAEECQCRGVGIDIAIAEVETELKKSKRVVGLGHDGLQRRFSTREMLQIEKQMFQSSNRLWHSNHQTVARNRFEAAIEQFPTLRPEQKAAVNHLVAGRDIVLVNGVAGSGKTFMLKVAGQIWSESGFDVVGTSLAAKAARTLQDETSIDSIHIHQLLSELGNGNRSFNEKTILVVDEAGMVGTRLMARLLQLVERNNSKIALIGDDRQLQAIAAGAPFRSIAERVGCVEMNEITRQREQWARQTVRDFRDGMARSALEQFWQKGLLSVADDRDEAIHSLVADWGKLIGGINGLRENLIFAGTNLDVSLINETCQNFLRGQGKLGNSFIEIGGYRLYEQDRIVITRNFHPLGLQNGAFGSINAVDTSKNSVQVQFDRGMQVWLDANEFAHFKLAYAVSTHKGQGQTVENAFVLVGGVMTDRELTYVQASRARGTTKLYADRLNSGYDLDLLAAHMSQSGAKTMASEYERQIA